MIEPFRLSDCPTRGNASEEQVAHNIARSERFARIEKSAPHGRKLAVVGGAPSLVNALDELREWDGDIWAINHTAAWLVDRGIDCTLLSVDPGPWEDPWAVTDGVKSALLATCCRPELFNTLGDDADVRTFHVYQGYGDPFITGGGTTACRAPFLGLHLGYTDISFFACESCFQDRSHAYKNTTDPKVWLKIKAGDQVFKTDLRMMLQAENLSILIKNFGGVFKDRSGGLLGAMIANIDTWGIVDMSDFLWSTLDKEVA